jgi:hypothetical protein
MKYLIANIIFIGNFISAFYINRYSNELSQCHDRGHGFGGLMTRVVLYSFLN